jgi:hypothetical protein
MEWVAAAEEYVGNNGWGARGKTLGISRMYSENGADKALIRKEKVVASLRPRGILSGFLAVVPNLGYAVYLPPIAAKMGPQRIRLRLSTQVLKDGAIFSAYFNKTRQLVIEDVLTWQSAPVWHTKPFKERWEWIVADFAANHLKPMLELQGTEIILAQYTSVNQIQAQEPDVNYVVEFVLNGSNTKRIIWIPPKVEPAPTTQAAKEPTPDGVKTSDGVKTPDGVNAPNGVKTPDGVNTPGANIFKVKKEMGPDVFSVWRGEERLGLGLVRTLAISRALRLANLDEIQVVAEHNKQFDKWEIKTVIEPKKSEG